MLTNVGGTNVISYAVLIIFSYFMALKCPLPVVEKQLVIIQAVCMTS